MHLTRVHVGAEGEAAVLDVKGEGVDVQVAGADHPHGHPVYHDA